MIYENFGKRLFDIICSLSGLVILSPLFILISVLIKIGSPGPIFFFQKRIGKEGGDFRLIKFRSMYSDRSQEKKGFYPGNGSRITRLGKVLRKTKIDEFPELINVLKGDMSLVGPRPEVPKYRHIYVGDFEPVLSLRPGITDLASIKYRNEEELLSQSTDPEKMYCEVTLPDKLRLCLKYKGMIGFKTDMKIIFATLRRVLGKRTTGKRKG
jgi:lipopolysaccharide/colanic/teichoic acid biosynthesis glycosyltransferase